MLPVGLRGACESATTLPPPFCACCQWDCAALVNRQRDCRVFLGMLPCVALVNRQHDCHLPLCMLPVGQRSAANWLHHYQLKFFERRFRPHRSEGGRFTPSSCLFILKLVVLCSSCSCFYLLVLFVSGHTFHFTQQLLRGKTWVYDQAETNVCL